MFTLLALTLAGCASDQAYVSVPKLPAWIHPADATPLLALRVVAECHALAPGAAVHYADSTYALVASEWLDQYLRWEWEAASATGAKYTAESWDCDEWADGFALFASFAAARAGVKAKPLVAVIVVQTSATERHALNAVATDAGIVVVEPQTTAVPFRVVPLAKYAPRILSISLGVPSS